MSPRSYVVTGASTGIGRACVAELVRTGAQVWATVRADKDADALSSEHGGRGARAAPGRDRRGLGP